MDEIKELEIRIAGYLHRAMEYEQYARDGILSNEYCEEKIAHKMEQAEWAERRLNWLRIGGD